MRVMVSDVGGCSAGVSSGTVIFGSAHTADKRDTKDWSSFFNSGSASKDRVLCRVPDPKIIPNVGHVAARL